MNEKRFDIARILIYAGGYFSIFLLGFIILFMTREALTAIQQSGEGWGRGDWRPWQYPEPEVNVLLLLGASVYCSLITLLVIGLPALGTAIWLVLESESRLALGWKKLFSGIRLFPPILVAAMGIGIMSPLLNFQEDGGRDSFVAFIVLSALWVLPSLIQDWYRAFDSQHQQFASVAAAAGISPAWMFFRMTWKAALPGTAIGLIRTTGLLMGESLLAVLMGVQRIPFPGGDTFAQPLASALLSELPFAAEGTFLYYSLFVPACLLLLISLILGWASDRLERHFGILDENYN